MVALTAPMVVLSPFGGWMADRVGRRAAAATGLVSLAGAMLPLAIVGGGADVPLLVCAMLGPGTGAAISPPPLQAAGIEALHLRYAGVASGLLSTGRYLGGIVAASLVAASVAGARRFAFATGAALLAAALSIALPGLSELVVAAV
jgi:DHA2 family methylenomycin A resistance protein-like MFS transporter